MSKARGPYRVDPLGYKKANEALDKMAENARELGLDYEPAQQEPVAAAAWQQGYDQGVSDERTSEANIGIAGFGAKINPARNNPYTSPPAQRTWVGLTDEERIMCRSYDPEEAVAKTEAKLREKNT